MTDVELLARKLTLVETYVQELRRQARPERMGKDLKEQRFILHTLQLAAQAALDAASHIVADERLGEPQSNSELFELLAKHGWLSGALAAELGKMAQFRNLLVHGYESVALDIVHDIVANRLDDLLAFSREIRRRVLGPESA
jgi:uncharacterized protein YutE (UPF0331/DUF86 family)